ncbi:MAG TPA: sugar transferase [Gaiellales bacterium]|jgi:exopolysaccharide biosynthesis polyprenyl glycosylphosphotransferase|nr:sugar transferase [Gaiellales bacterium]
MSSRHQAYATTATTAAVRPRGDAGRAHQRTPWLLLALSDAVALTLAIEITRLTESHGADLSTPTPGTLFEIAAIAGLMLVLAGALGLYGSAERRAQPRTVDETTRLLILCLAAAYALVTAGWLGANSPSALRALLLPAVALTLLVAGRSLTRALMLRRGSARQNALIVGTGDLGRVAARKLERHREYGIDLAGFVDDVPDGSSPDIGGARLLGPLDRLPDIVRSHRIDRVIIADSAGGDRELIATIRGLDDTDTYVDIVPGQNQLMGPKTMIHELEGLPLVSLAPCHRKPRAALVVKRAFDVVAASALLVVTAPLFAFAAWRIRRDSPGPVIFRQTRLGAGMRDFSMLKFRTMAVHTDAAPHQQYIERAMNGEVPEDDARLQKLDREDVITGPGRWLRRSSLDELPQLINVLRGDMSLVGPRPCIPYEATHFAPHQFERFSMPAGITGLWQVTARGHATFAEALEMDVVYVRDWSLRLDASLVARTVVEVLRKGKATV